MSAYVPEIRGLSEAQVAVLVKKRLKVLFPKAKFRVLSSADGFASFVNIAWTDGPTYDEVFPVADTYTGRGFDGMIDFSYYVTSWLLPDGSAQPASSPGTRGQLGAHDAYDYPQPHPEAERVNFFCYVTCSRNHSEALLRYALAQYEQEHGSTKLVVVPPEHTKRWERQAWLDGDYDLATEVYRLARSISTLTVDITKAVMA